MLTSHAVQMFIVEGRILCLGIEALAIQCLTQFGHLMCACKVVEFLAMYIRLCIDEQYLCIILFLSE